MPDAQQIRRGVVGIGRQRADSGELALMKGGEGDEALVRATVMAGEPFLAQPLDEAVAFRARLMAQGLEIVRQAFRQPDDLDGRCGHRPSNRALEM